MRLSVDLEGRYTGCKYLLFSNFFTGVSDPYVRCLHGQDKLFQSRAMPKTVNPSWDETFDVHIDNPFKAITLQV